MTKNIKPLQRCRGFFIIITISTKSSVFNIPIIHKLGIMQSYYISQSNSYTFRTQPTASTSNQFTMSLTDMTTLTTFTASMSGITYEGYESYIGFTASISGAIVASEYRAVLYNGTPTGSVDIWRGTMQVYESQSIDKSVYENQIPPIISHESENKYIIYN